MEALNGFGNSHGDADLTIDPTYPAVHGPALPTSAVYLRQQRQRKSSPPGMESLPGHFPHCMSDTGVGGCARTLQSPELKAQSSPALLLPPRLLSDPKDPGLLFSCVPHPDALKVQVVWELYWILRAQYTHRLKLHWRRALAGLLPLRFMASQCHRNSKKN